MGWPMCARWMRIWCLRPVRGKRRSREKFIGRARPSVRARFHLGETAGRGRRPYMTINLRSTKKSVCAGAPSGRTQSLMATMLCSSLPSGASIVPCSAATWPWTMARYSFSTARLSRIFPSSPAVCGIFCDQNHAAGFAVEAVDQKRSKARRQKAEGWKPAQRRFWRLWVKLQVQAARGQ